MKLKSTMCVFRVFAVWLAVGVTAYAELPVSALAPDNTGLPAIRFVSEIAPSDVRPHIEYLASDELRGRTGYGAKLARRYIIQHFQKLGLQPLFEDDLFEQAIPAGKTAADGFFGVNVGAVLPGTDPSLRDELIVIGAHYDHLGVRDGKIYAGADDNASGVSMMLEVAAALATGKHRPARSVVFLGFDLEENMLWGSRWFAAHPPWPIENVKLFITADMIGRSLGGLSLPTVFLLGSEHAEGLPELLDDLGEPEGLDVSRLGIDLIGTRSDYGPFRDREIPFLFFSTGEHRDYHTPRDVPERIDYEKVAGASGMVLKIVRRAANDEMLPTWTRPSTSNLDEVRTLNRITKMLLNEQAAGPPLNGVQRLVVEQVQRHSNKILVEGEMSPSDRTWLVRMSQVLLLSVF